MQIILFKDLKREVEREFIDDSGQIYLGITFTYGLPDHSSSASSDLHLRPSLYQYFKILLSGLRPRYSKRGSQTSNTSIPQQP